MNRETVAGPKQRDALGLPAIKHEIVIVNSQGAANILKVRSEAVSQTVLVLEPPK
jgi:hypothetical protein